MEDKKKFMEIIYSVEEQNVQKSMEHKCPQ